MMDATTDGSGAGSHGPTATPAQAHLTVFGFHGTTREAADEITAHGFQVSKNEYDWLGDGIYFFQDAPVRAWQWAIDQHGADSAAVVGTELRLTDCLDLLDIKWTQVVSGVYSHYITNLKQAGLALPRQTPGAHRLDREVRNYAVGVLGEHGVAIACVRAAFVEGRPVYPDSALYDRAHVQIAVRTPEQCVRRTWVESRPGPEGVEE